MKTIKVNLKKRTYNILVGEGIINETGKYARLLKLGTDAYIITNPLIKNKYAHLLRESLSRRGISARFKTVPDTEKSKSIEMSASVIKDIASYDKKRKIFIIALGGGVVGDLSGFVASIYKRGVPYIQIPTTLLAQVDSAIGGKTAVDLTEGKNLVGAFYQPRLVLSDVGLLRSLNKKQLRNGLAEVIKYGIIKDPQLFSYLEKKHKQIIGLKPRELEHIIWRSGSIKADIVSKDEREELGVRTILNFGHTIGHAIEAAAGFEKYGHGEAVGLGMLAAGNISVALKLLDIRGFKRIEGLIKTIGLPSKIKGISLERIIKSHYKDKKFKGNRNRFVLAASIGRVKILENIPLKIIKDSLSKVF